MRSIIIKFGIIVLLSACQNKDPKARTTTQSAIHEVKIVEVVQTSQYTYLLVEEGDIKSWLAVPRMQAEAGKTYYYQGGMLMKNFVSKELGRTFENIIFLESIHTDREEVGKVKTMPESHTEKSTSGKAGLDKLDINVEVAKGGITIADLFSNMDSYDGKIVKIKGQVTKFSDSIMKRNWIHLQDGTDHNGAYDMTITSDIFVKVGDIVTIEGKIALNKDFGYGYFYEVIMEEGVLK